MRVCRCSILSEQYRNLADPIRRELDEILRTQNFILGSKVEEFERALAEYFRARNTPSAFHRERFALLAIFMALGFGPNDSVITSAYTFFATAGCLARLGARPAFIDIDPAQTYNISSEALARFLGTRAVGTRKGS